MKESLSGLSAPELFQFRPQGPYSLSASQSDPDLFIWERAFYVLDCAVASLQSLLCNPAISFCYQQVKQRTYIGLGMYGMRRGS